MCAGPWPTWPRPAPICAPWRGGQRGKVVLSILHSLAHGIGTLAVARLRQTRPEIAIKMIEDQNDELIERVRNRQVDFGIGMFIQAADDLTFDPLFLDELVAAFPADHEFNALEEVSWERLATVPLILIQPQSSIRRLVEAGLLVAGNVRQPITEVVSMVTALNMAAAGLGVTVVPRLTLPYLMLGNLQSRPIGHPKPIRRIGILRRTSRYISNAETLLIEQIIKAAKEMKLYQPEP